MHAPSILPWVARRNALSLERAEELWGEAVLMADFHFGRGNVGPDYWKYALETFLRLARCDGAALVADPAAAPAASPALEAIETQGRIGELTLSAVERFLRLGTRLWLASVARAANDEVALAARRQ